MDQQHEQRHGIHVAPFRRGRPSSRLGDPRTRSLSLSMVTDHFSLGYTSSTFRSLRAPRRCSMVEYITLGVEFALH
jgi:hypothetical protein